MTSIDTQYGSNISKKLRKIGHDKYNKIIKDMIGQIAIESEHLTYYTINDKYIIKDTKKLKNNKKINGIHIHNKDNAYHISHLPCEKICEFIEMSKKETKYLFLSMTYSKATKDHGHIGILCFDLCLNKIILLDPNGIPPFKNIVDKVICMLTFEINKITKSKMKYIDMPTQCINKFEENSLVGNNLCCSISLYLINKISHGELDYSQLYYTQNRVDINKIENELFLFLNSDFILKNIDN